MERLHQVVCLAALLSSGAPGLAAAPPQEACSLVVRALEPDGRRPQIPISVREQSGRIEEKKQVDADVRFCDLGILPVTVTVGSDSMCGQVTVHEVPVSLYDTYLLTVTYDPDGCPERIPPPVASCRMLFRVADASGKWISGASIHISSPEVATLTTDQFGRALFGADLGSTLRGSVTAPGLPPAEIAWACTDQEPHEKLVKLEKR
jgi:hypothetical protein